ncbi:unnamed protein product, partial [Onchocerca flexuosa]|uniref:Nucleotide-binding alpha-beta plait domain-containing protein n=1 Tax=Onchocerca flexuosa TaxID=387005 RepID=A0A183I6Y0_9BILA
MRVPGPNTFMSSNYNMPLPRYNASCGSLNMRANRPGMFPGRSPFSPYRGGPPFGGAPLRGENRWRNSEPGNGHVNNSRHDEWDNNAMVPSSSHEEYAQLESSKIGKRKTERTEMDDSSNEPVTSTTHDDESATVSGTVEVLASEAKLLNNASIVPNNDDLKVMS